MEADTSQDDGLDVEAAIANFLADPDRLSLELPHMTTGQRRRARKLTEDSPELKCESYGFGPERQLHIFKKGFEGPSKPPAVNVKNTFILPKGLQAEVRNTFIHIEGDSVVDERIVQTMPRDMFRQHVNHELSTDTAIEPAAAFVIAEGTMCSGGLSSLPPSPCAFRPAHSVELPAPTTAFLLQPGTQIMVEGLVRAPGFNGLAGVVQFYEQDTGRYSVLLALPAGGMQQAKIKGENLRLLAPPPYCAMGAKELPLIPGAVATPLRLTALV